MSKQVIEEQFSCWYCFALSLCERSDPRLNSNNGLSDKPSTVRGVSTIFDNIEWSALHMKEGEKTRVQSWVFLHFIVDWGSKNMVLTASRDC